MASSTRLARRSVLAPVHGRRQRADERTLPPRLLPWLLTACFTAIYAVLSVRRHDMMQTRAFDLGIFEQAVRGYAEGRGPVVPLKGDAFNLLGDHFSPILATLGPVYHVFPHAVTLLLAQAVLLALSVAPITAWAQQAFGERAALAIGIGIGASWGVAQAVAFDFHEVAFAVPFLAFSLTALGRGRLVSACLWALPLVLVKEDLGITVMVIGVLVAHRGARRTGLLTAAAGIAATVLTVTLLIPRFNADGRYPYGGQATERTLTEMVAGAASLPALWTVIVLLVPTGFLALRSPLLLVAVPTLAWRFLSDNPAYHGTGYHYSAVLVPVVFAAFVDALIRTKPAARRRAYRASLAVTVVLLPFFGFRDLVAPPQLVRGAAVASARGILAAIPDGATVAASNTLAPQLTDRTTVSLFGAVRRPVTCPQYIALDNSGLGDLLDDEFPSSRVAQSWLYYQARAMGYGQVAADSWVTVLRYTGVRDSFYSDLVADGPPTYLTDPATGGTDRADDFVWRCR